MPVDYVHQYCYCREKKYYPFGDADLAVRDDFAYRIEVKENAPDLLRRALSRAPVGVVGTGDYQPVGVEGSERFIVHRHGLHCLAGECELHVAGLPRTATSLSGCCYSSIMDAERREVILGSCCQA